MLPRFLVPDLDASRPEATLPPEEAHHLLRVLRLRVGDAVSVFDGRGLEFLASVYAVSRGTVTVSLGARAEAPPAPTLSLTLVQSVVKAMDDVIRDATMAGIACIEPVISANTTVKAAVVRRAADRWRRVSLASAKQSGRARLPEIREAVDFGSWLALPQARGAFLLVEPALTGAGVSRVRDLCERPAPPAASLVIGPEGGWTARERDAALQAGLTPLSLGRLTLRADAVPLAAAAALLAIWDL